MKPNRPSPDWRSELINHRKKVPPDPSKARPKPSVNGDTVSAVEHSLAKITYPNSQPLSTSKKTYVTVLKQKSEIGSKMTEKRVLQRKDGKDGEAIHWEPPKLEKKCRVGEIFTVK